MPSDEAVIIRALALRELELRDWWRVAVRELPSGLTLGAILAAVGATRIVRWQQTGCKTTVSTACE